MANEDRINRDIGTEPAAGAATGTDWPAYREYWRTNFMSRPYVSVDRGFEFYEPGYRYGFEEARRVAGRTWDDVRGDLERGWNQLSYRGEAKWEDVKDAVRDAWERIKGNR